MSRNFRTVFPAPWTLTAPALLLVTMFAIYLVLDPTIANAQSDEPIVGYRILGEDSAGPHIVQLQVSPGAPIVGTSRFAVRVRDNETGEDIDNATVRLFGTPAEEGKKQYTPALNSPFDPVFYLGQLDFEHAGIWAIDVEVETELGSGVTIMSLQVAPRARSGSGNAAGTMLFLLVTLAFAGGAGWVWYSSKRARVRQGRL